MVLYFGFADESREELGLVEFENGAIFIIGK